MTGLKILHMYTIEDMLDVAVLNDNIMNVKLLLPLWDAHKVIRASLRKLRLLRCEPCRNDLLHIAAYSNSIKVIRLLLDLGSDFDSRNSVGDTPLHIAARYGSWEVADLLISYGAKLDIPNLNRMLPIDVANQSGNTKVVELFRLTYKINDSGVT